MRSPKGMVWLLLRPGIATIILRDRAAAERFVSEGWDVEGPYVPGRTHNPHSPRAIRDRLNDFRKD